MKKNLLLIFLVMLVSAESFAGWIITLRESESDGTTYYETMMIEDNMMKSAGHDGSFIFNVNSREFYMIDDANKTYWQGQLDDFRENYYNAMKVAVDQMLSGLPPEQREMYKQMFGDMVEIYSDPDPAKIKSVNIEVKKAGEAIEIAGYASTKYEVTVDGKLVEELWLSDELDVNEDLDFKAIAELMNEIRPNLDDEFLYEYTDEYMRLWEKGFRMKSIDDNGDMSEVIKVEKKKISASEFQAPEGYSRLTIEEMMQQQMMGGDEEDDQEEW